MSKVTILTKPNRIVIASKGVQGAPGPQGEQGIQGPKGDTGDVTPEALAARDAAQEAAEAAAQSAADTADALGPLAARVTALEENPAFPDAPDDGGAYIRVNGQWVQLYAPLALAGDLPDGTVDEPYSATLAASGGRPPYAIGDVLLPPGLDATLSDATVTVAGTPSEEWDSEAHIDLSDSLGTAIRRTLDVQIDPVPAPVIDLFVIVGQSNAEGRGDSVLSPAAPYGVEIDAGVLSSPLADPVGDALTGSMWPSFSNEWYARTGRMSAFVEAAHGGAALLPDQAGTNWSPSGSLRGSAVTMANDAIAAINAADSLTLGSVYFVWSQGETDAENGVSEADYESALEEIAAYFKAQVPAMNQMLVVRTGARNNLADGARWAAIRSAQDAACAASPNLRMVYRGTSSFNLAGRAMMADALHYNQEGLNLAGKCAALAGATLTTNPVVQPAPAILASEAYMDTSVDTGSSATNAHTTAAGTKTLVVAVAFVRMTTSSTNIPNNVTFDGVAMVKANALANQSAGGNSAPAQRADVAIFYLTEAQYGAPLGGVTGDIVVVSAANTHVISSAAYDLDAEVVQEAAFGVRISSTTGSSLPLSLTTGAPAALIGAVSSAGLSASPLTHTLSGIAETGDGGVSDGTHCGQAAFGSATVGEVSGSSITATLSADVRAAAFLVAAFRKKIQGE